MSAENLSIFPRYKCLDSFCHLHDLTWSFFFGYCRSRTKYHSSVHGLTGCKYRVLLDQCFVVAYGYQLILRVFQGVGGCLFQDSGNVSWKGCNHFPEGLLDLVKTIATDHAMHDKITSSSFWGSIETYKSSKYSATSFLKTTEPFHS